MELDIYLPQLKLAFEFNGTYWHSDAFIAQRTKGFITSAQEYHDHKTAECEKLGIKLIHIDEAEWLKDKQSVMVSIKSQLEHATVGTYSVCEMLQQRCIGQNRSYTNKKS